MSLETISGQVADIKLHRESWGRITLLYGSDRERATVTGHPLGVEHGDTVECSGTWTRHPTYGLQFKASSIRVVAPSDASGAIEWILSRLPGIGRRRATQMLERWPVPEIWAVLGERPHELAHANGGIAGITVAGAARIAEAYRRHIGERDMLVALRGWGLTDRQAARVVHKWGAETIEKLRADPYLLSAEIEGFGFKRSDAIAQKMGLPADHPSRIRAGLEHLLSEARQAGHTYVSAGKLIAMAARLLGVPEDAVVEVGRVAITDGRLVRRETRNRAGELVQRVYAPELDEAEQVVADAVKRLVRGGLRDAEDRRGEDRRGDSVRRGRERRHVEDDGFEALGAEIDRRVAGGAA